MQHVRKVRRTGAEVAICLTLLAHDVVSPNVSRRLEREAWVELFRTEITDTAVNKQVLSR